MALIKFKSKVSTILSSIFWIGLIVGYYYATRYIAELDASDLQIVQVKLFNRLFNVSQLDAIVYSILGFKLLDSWIDGLVNSILNVAIVLVLMFGMFLDTNYNGLPIGVVSFKITYDPVVSWLRIQILWLLLLFLIVYVVGFTFDLVKFLFEKNNPCVNEYWESHNGNYQEYLDYVNDVEERTHEKKIQKVKKELYSLEEQSLAQQHANIVSNQPVYAQRPKDISAEIDPIEPIIISANENSITEDMGEFFEIAEVEKKEVDITPL